jgi:hypothetical protein
MQTQEVNDEIQEEHKLFFGEEEVLEILEGREAKTKRIRTSKGAFDLPEWEFDVSLTTEPRSLSDVRNARANVIVKKILELQLEMNIFVADIPDIVRKLLNTLQNNEERVVLKTFGKELKEEIRMKDVDDLLKRKE